MSNTPGGGNPLNPQAGGPPQGAPLLNAPDQNASVQQAASGIPGVGLGAQPGGYVPGGAAPLNAPGARIGLNGEAIQNAPPTSGAPQPGSYGGNTYQAAPRPAYGGPRPMPEATSSGGSKVLPLVAALVVVGLLGFGGFWFWSHRSNPKDNMQKFLTAFGTEDYKTVYNLVDLPEDQKTKYPTAEAFETDIKQQMSNPLVTTIMGPLREAFKSAKVGDPKVDGDTAQVPVTFTVTFLGQTNTKTQDLPMKNVGGTWKVSGQGGGVGVLGGSGFGGAGGGGGGLTGKSGG